MKNKSQLYVKCTIINKTMTKGLKKNSRTSPTEQCKICNKIVQGELLSDCHLISFHMNFVQLFFP